MTDRPIDPEARDTDLQSLHDADPADAPGIAEDLADRLAGELDGTTSTPEPVPEDPS
ncbi:MAG: hypothetical protein M3092_09325 [Actinomycetia bacterium]|nr:hypothetical protein [Actinomycetes bacterium]